MLEENEAGCLAQGVLPAESHAHALHEPPRRVVALEPLPLSGGRANAQLIPPERRDRHSLRRAAELGVLPAHFYAIAGKIVPAATCSSVGYLRGRRTARWAALRH